MCVKNTHFKCLKSYYRDSRVEVTHLFLECNIANNVIPLKMGRNESVNVILIISHYYIIGISRKGTCNLYLAYHVWSPYGLGTQRRTIINCASSMTHIAIYRITSSIYV